jgi:hypothetical protein
MCILQQVRSSSSTWLISFLTRQLCWPYLLESAVGCQQLAAFCAELGPVQPKPYMITALRNFFHYRMLHHVHRETAATVSRTSR